MATKRSWAGYRRAQAAYRKAVIATLGWSPEGAHPDDQYPDTTGLLANLLKKSGKYTQRLQALDDAIRDAYPDRRYLEPGGVNESRRKNSSGRAGRFARPEDRYPADPKPSEAATYAARIVKSLNPHSQDRILQTRIHTVDHRAIPVVTISWYSGQTDKVLERTFDFRSVRTNGKGKKRSMRGKSASQRAARRLTYKKEKRSIGAMYRRRRKKEARKVHHSVGTKRAAPKARRKNPMKSVTYGTYIPTVSHIRKVLAAEGLTKYSYTLRGGDDRTAERTRIPSSGSFTPYQLNAILRKLKKRYDKGDDKAGDLASSIVYTLGVEWV